jgi:beta-phosphoglucomutase-like phosphatase (HAD superfamily)
MNLPGIGVVDLGDGLAPLQVTRDGRFRVGQSGVQAIVATGDRRVEFVAFASHTLAHVRSAMGYPAYYPVHETSLRRPVRAVLMDLDGTSVRSERFWVWIIEKTTASLLSQPGFRLEEVDLPFVSGHSVSEHLHYCIDKYCPGRTVEEARRLYFQHTQRELAAILEGKGQADAFIPAPHLREFLLALKDAHIRVALVTSGLEAKAWPAIVAAFRRLGMGDPRDFYDTIITAGAPLGAGRTGTLGELCAKPHPWLYAEAARVGLGSPFEERGHIVGIEDSGAGVCAVRLAGFTTIGVAGGNILSSGTRSLCDHYIPDLSGALQVILDAR